MVGLLDEWWFWLAAAAVFAILEVVIPAWVFLGFAVGAAAMGVLIAIGLSVTPAWSVLVFGILSAAGYAALRYALGSSRGHVKIIDRDINEN